MPLKKSQKSLKKWTGEKWGTKSGKNSTQGKKATGERYLPKAARGFEQEGIRGYQQEKTRRHGGG